MQEGTHVKYRPQLGAADAKRNHRYRMAMHNGHHIRPGTIDLAVDEALQKRLAGVAADGVRLQVELHHIADFGNRRRARAGHHKMIRIAITARTQMAIGIQHLVPGQDMQAVDQVFQQGLADIRLVDALGRCPDCLRRGFFLGGRHAGQPTCFCRKAMVRSRAVLAAASSQEPRSLQLKPWPAA